MANAVLYGHVSLGERWLAVTEVRVSVAHSPRELERLVRHGFHRQELARRAPSPHACFRRRGGRPAVSLFFLAVGYDWHLVLWSAALLPMWILLAKLMGLYDNDHRALRHLTADEFGQLFTWAVRGTVIACLVLYLAPSASITVAKALEMAAIVLAAAFSLRALGRYLWRRRVPPERTLIVGAGAIAEATRRISSPTTIASRASSRRHSRSSTRTGRTPPIPDRRLAGSGVAFKVAQLLLAGEPGGPAAALALADLATIGTVADVAPVVGENRAIARLGLERLRRGAAARHRGAPRARPDRARRGRPRDRRLRHRAAAQRRRPGGGGPRGRPAAAGRRPGRGRRSTPTRSRRPT